jgi:hypothetical protein
MNLARKTRRRREQSPQPVEVPGPEQRTGRAEAAIEIMERARELRDRAEHGDFGLIVYLLDMVMIEAQDTATSSRAEKIED